MATKKTKTSDKSADAKITRIKATDSQPTKQPVEQTVVKEVKEPKTEKTKKPNALKSFFGYFKGAWEELKLVRWPNRRATWSLTMAVIAFTAIFVGIIILLDLGFSKLLEVMLG